MCSTSRMRDDRLGLKRRWCLALRQGLAEGLALNTSRLKRQFSGRAPPLYFPDNRPPASGLKVVVPSP